MQGAFFDVPHFIVDLAEVRAQAVSRREQEEGDGPQSLPQICDRLDVLLVDSLTVYMSAWRILPPQVGPLDSGRSQSSIGRRSSSPRDVAPVRSGSQARGPRGAGVGLVGDGPDRQYSPRLKLGQRPTVP